MCFDASKKKELQQPPRVLQEPHLANKNIDPKSGRGRIPINIGQVLTKDLANRFLDLKLGADGIPTLR